MRLSLQSLSVVALLSSGAIAQSLDPLTYATSIFSQLSPSCQQVLLSLATPSSPVFQCMQISSLAPLLTSNSSIIPPLDGFAAAVCSNSPCSNSTLTGLVGQITSGCATDLQSNGISNATVAEIVGAYPLAREVVCLKTSMPLNATNATIPISNSTYNTTNGTFCSTSLLTGLSSYLGANLTVPYLANAVLSNNSSMLSSLKSIPSTMLCDDCIFGALDLIEEQFPAVASIQVAQNVTLNSYLNGTCNATGYVVTSNGTLPKTLSETASNSTFGYNVTAGNYTYTPSTPPPAHR